MLLLPVRKITEQRVAGGISVAKRAGLAGQDLCSGSQLPHQMAVTAFKSPAFLGLHQEALPSQAT